MECTIILFSCEEPLHCAVSPSVITPTGLPAKVGMRRNPGTTNGICSVLSISSEPDMGPGLIYYNS